MKNNPEKRERKDRSYRKGGEQIRDLREAAHLDEWMARQDERQDNHKDSLYW